MYETLITLFGSATYFGADVAVDAGVPEKDFLPPWRASGDDRTTGRTTFETVVEKIMRDHGCFSEEKLAAISAKRIRKNEDAYTRLHAGVLPMLRGLRERGAAVGLVSNCYFEEAYVIRRSVLFPCFDAVCLSCEEGVMKPDPAIFLRCAEKLGVQPEECLYIGDGGSRELETADSLGMTAAQALWYVCGDDRQEFVRRPQFRGLDEPEDVFSLL